MRMKKGFTLIELLVVIAIIAVLMAILFPALNRAKEQGKRTMCLGNLKALTLSWIMYADDNKTIILNYRNLGCKYHFRKLYYPPEKLQVLERVIPPGRD